MASVWESKKCTQQSFNEKINEETWVWALVNIVVNLKLEIPRPAEWVSGFEEGLLAVCHVHNYLGKNLCQPGVQIWYYTIYK